MPLVKKIKSRGGANIVMTAEAELLFTPSGDIARWNNSLSQRVRSGVTQVAPRNKRPRWKHYGKALRHTIKATTDMQVRNGGGYARTAVGSSAPYALFVDQGTKSFDAKILPPWRKFSPSLYEHTWKVPVNTGTDASGRAVIEWQEVGTIRVSGQKARYFFDIGLRGGINSMRVATRMDYGDPLVSRASRTFPDRLADYVTTDYNAGNPAFEAQLDEWRSWRDSAWASKIPLGEGRPLTNRRNKLEAEYNRVRARRDAEREARRAISEPRRRARKRQNQEDYRRRQGVKPRSEYDKMRRNNVRQSMARDADKARVRLLAEKQFGAGNVDNVYFAGGQWKVSVVVSRNSRGVATYKVFGIKAKFKGASTTPDDDF